MRLIGWLICTLRGNHEWTRKKKATHRVCARCGATAPIKPRGPRKQKELPL